MTEDKDFKQLVRQTASASGQSYVKTRDRLRQRVEGTADSRAVKADAAVESTAPLRVTGSVAPDHVRAFRGGGAVLHIPGGFPRAVALDIQRALWDDVESRLPVRRDDPASWVQPGLDRSWGARRAVPEVEALRRAHLHRLDPVFDALLGEGTWAHPGGWGSGVLVSAPWAPSSPWSLTTPEWHADGPPLRGCWYFVLLGDVAARRGATLAVEGSGVSLQRWVEALPDDDDRSRNVQRFIDSEPFLRRLTGVDPAEDPSELLGPQSSKDGTMLRVVELAGQAGDVFVLDSNVLHAAPTRTAPAPRFVARQFLHYGPKVWRGPSAIRRERRAAASRRRASPGRR